MKTKLAIVILTSFLFYMFFCFFGFLSGGILSEKEVSFERGFYQLSTTETNGNVNEFVLLTCIHCIKTMKETSSFFKKNNIKLLRVHPYYNDKQRILAIFFYLNKMENDDSAILSFIDYINLHNMDTASNIDIDKLYEFYKNIGDKEKILSQHDFESILNGNKDSEFMIKAKQAKSKADLIGLKATPAFLFKDKITSFSMFKENIDMLNAIKAEYSADN